MAAFSDLLASDSVGTYKSSDNGVTWGAYTVPEPILSAFLATEVVTNNLIILAMDGSHSYTSTDGETWATNSITPVFWWAKPVWTGTHWVTVGYNSALAASSTDGVTWTTHALPTSRNWTKIVWSGSRLCAFSDTTYVARSVTSDGSSWAESSVYLADQVSVGFAIAGVFVMVCTVSGLVYSSTDCITWSYVTAIGGAAQVVVKGTRACISPTVSTSIYTTDDAVTFTARTLPSLADWYSIAQNGTVFIVGDQVTGLIATSPDGITWTSQTSPLIDGGNVMQWPVSVDAAPATGNFWTDFVKSLETYS